MTQFYGSIIIDFGKNTLLSIIIDFAASSLANIDLVEGRGYLLVEPSRPELSDFY